MYLQKLTKYPKLSGGRVLPLPIWQPKARRAYRKAFEEIGKVGHGKVIRISEVAPGSIQSENDAETSWKGVFSGQGPYNFDRIWRYFLSPSSKISSRGVGGVRGIAGIDELDRGYNEGFARRFGPKTFCSAPHVRPRSRQRSQA